MATPPVIGGNNDRYALTEAQRNTVTALVVVEHLLDHLAELRMATGQPDYSKLNQLVAQLAVSLAKVQAYQTDMERIRFQTKRESIYAISNKNAKG